MNTLDDYYRNSYGSVQRGGINAWGNRLMDSRLLRALSTVDSREVLELGASSGEFTQLAMEHLNASKYIASDLHPGVSSPENIDNLVGLYGTRLQFLTADATYLPFDDSSFSLTFSTCLLAHVNSPSEVIREAIRVTRAGGNVFFLIPCDPGFMNQAIKQLITYPRMRRRGLRQPEYVYALEHPNPVHNILALLRHQADGHHLHLRFHPFGWKSWQFNLFIVARIRVL